jgi:hypothetical protein
MKAKIKTKRVKPSPKTAPPPRLSLTAEERAMLQDLKIQVLTVRNKILELQRESQRLELLLMQKVDSLAAAKNCYLNIETLELTPRMGEKPFGEKP